jgi:hypothetical protein
MLDSNCYQIYSVIRRSLLLRPILQLSLKVIMMVGCVLIRSNESIKCKGHTKLYIIPKTLDILKLTEPI